MPSLQSSPSPPCFCTPQTFPHPKLRPQIEERNIQIGYSNSRTCEIGLTTNSGIPYVSIAYLVDECTTAKDRKEEQAL